MLSRDRAGRRTAAVAALGALAVIAGSVGLGADVPASADPAQPRGIAGVSDGLELWLTASAGTQNGSAAPAAAGEVVALWEDQSGNERDALGWDSLGQATKTDGALNFNPTLSFDDDVYRVDSAGLPTGSADRSVFIVASATGSTLWRYILGGGRGPGTGQGFDFGRQNGGEGVFLTGHPGPSVTTGSWTPVGSARLAYGHARDGRMGIAVNGGSVSESDAGVNSVYGDGLKIGANSDGTERWLGDIAEVVFFDRVLTSAEAQRVNSYLALKYGFSLADGAQDYIMSDGSVVWDTSERTGFTNRVFGVGVDAASELEQRKSTSQSAQSILTVTGGAAMADGDFVLLSDNGGAATWNTDATRANSYQHLSRVWTSTVTGTPGPVTLGFALDAADFDVPATPDGNRYVLLVDRDDDGVFTDETEVALTLNTATGLMEATVDLTGDPTFTIGTPTKVADPVRTPAAGATDVSLDGDLVLEFSRTVTATGTGLLTLTPTAGGDPASLPVATSPAIAGRGTATLEVPLDAFDVVEGTEYAVTLAADTIIDPVTDIAHPGITGWTFTTFTDADGIDAEVEDAAPGEGDGNGDGIADSTQKNVASLPDPFASGRYVTVEVNAECALTEVAMLDPDDIDDPRYVPGRGMVSFEAECASGTGADVVLHFHDTPASSSPSLRKFFPSTGTSTAVAGARIETVAQGSRTVMRVSYRVDDNGVYDLDPTVGKISDPVFLLTPAATALSTTGASPVPTLALAGALLTAGLAGVIVVKRRSRPRQDG